MANALPLAFPRDAALPRAQTKPATSRPRQGWARRLADAFVKARQREADRAIARYLESTGGKLTDSAEREILRRLDA
jgi:hypothetical protein